MSWGISIVLLALFNCRGKKSSFPKLQLLAHSVRSEKGREDMRALLQGRLRVTDISVRVEPWLNRAVNYAHGLRLVDVTKGKSVKLTVEGKKVVTSLNSKDVLQTEREFLSDLGRQMTEHHVTAIWRMEDLL